MDIDVTEPAPADSALRRRLLGIGLGGAAVSLLPFLVGRASATTPTSGPDRHRRQRPRPRLLHRSGRPTTTSRSSASPNRSSSLRRNLYDVALGTDDFDDVDAGRHGDLRESHDAYAASLSGLLGREAPQEVNPVFDELQSSVRRRHEAACSRRRTTSSRRPSPRTSTSSASCREPTGLR